jgi:alpha-beta hydrolase superfamily lysophospholipase
MKKIRFTFPSVVGDCDLAAVEFLPDDGKIRGVVQIVHGMLEHIDRYDHFAEQFVSQGYAVYGHSHLGHGYSVNDRYPRGYFGKQNEAGYVFRQDVFQLTERIREKHPNIPIVLFGYSMGSFVCRTCIGERGNDYAAAIICSTGGANKALNAGILGAKTLSAVHGKSPGKQINKILFQQFLSRTEHRTSVDWLSTDVQHVDNARLDPLSQFTFSNRGFYDLFTLNKYAVSDKIYNGTPKSLPILLVSGAEAPVGHYGALVKDSYQRYLQTEHTAVEMKLYPGRRHEIHLDAGGTDAINDILAFLAQRL